MRDLQNFPPNTKINWSATARQYDITHKCWADPERNGNQTRHQHISVKESKVETTPRIRRRKCRLPGGEISMPCLPTVRAIKEEEKQLILCGELNIGEPCAPFHCTKSVITEEGNVEFKSVLICGRKIPLHDL